MATVVFPMVIDIDEPIPAQKLILEWDYWRLVANINGETVIMPAKDVCAANVVTVQRIKLIERAGVDTYTPADFAHYYSYEAVQEMCRLLCVYAQFNGRVFGNCGAAHLAMSDTTTGGQIVQIKYAARWDTSCGQWRLEITVTFPDARIRSFIAFAG
jgi:hypothetical protein